MDRFDHLVLGEESLFYSDMDNYINGNDENFNHLDIIHLFGKERLENIQKSLSKATGLAFITVDFRGEPITEATYFSRFCQHIRNFPHALERCKSSDAFGSIQAAVTQKTNVYFCPCGLLEVAIPIVVRGHYLGGFIGGQIRCNDAPDSISRLASVMHFSQSEKSEEYIRLMEEIPVYSYEKFLDIANLVFLVINQLGENEVSQYMQADVLKKKIKKVQKTSQKYLKELKQKNKQLQESKMQSNPYYLLDAIGSLLNLSIIEDAPQTNELLNTLADFVRYSYEEQASFTYLSGELEHAERYLTIKKKKLGERMEYSIQVPKEMQMQRIPAHILLPFVQNAFYNGIMLKNEGGKITITGSIKNNHVILEICDTGSGLTQDELDIKFEAFKDYHEGPFIKLGMDYAQEKMKQLFGDGYDIIIEDPRGKGRKCIIRWPERFEEREEEVCTEF